jgi:hypothetical protein
MEKNQYSCVMVGFDLFNWDVFTKKFINPNDLTHKGLETEAHCTILYGLAPDVNLDEVKSLTLPLKDIYCTSSEINFFSNKEFDVVKFDITAPKLTIMHDVMLTLPHGEVRPDYNPHLTIAYVEPGMGIQYARTIKPLVLQPVNYMLSRPNGEVIYWTV